MLTPNDPALPRELLFDSDGKERFRKYIPFPSFVNTIENHPYPYLIGGRCWEFPCIVPSDWEAQYLHKPAHPKTLEDMKAALDCVVVKRGVFDLVLHPYGWIKNEQVVDLVDYADKKYGKKVKLLNFKEALERLNQNLAEGRNLREPGGRSVVTKSNSTAQFAAGAGALPPGARRLDERGRDAGLRMVDLDEDGHDDVVFSNDEAYGIYLFDIKSKGWTRKVMAGKAGEPGGLPRIVRDGTNNGFFVHSRSLWWQNEDTASLPNLVDRRTFNDLLKDVEPSGKSSEASLRSIRVEPGFTVQLAAYEPLVKDPIAFDWGPTAGYGYWRWGIILSGPTEKESPAEWSASSRTRTVTVGTTNRPCSSMASASRRASWPGGTVCWSPAPRISCTPRTTTAMAAPIVARCSSPASTRATRSIASTASSSASTAGCTVRTETAAGPSDR